MVGAALETDRSSGGCGVPFGVSARTRRQEPARTEVPIPAFGYILDIYFDDVYLVATNLTLKY